MNNIKELTNIIEGLGGKASFNDICSEYQRINKIVLSSNHKITLAHTLNDNKNKVYFDGTQWVLTDNYDDNPDLKSILFKGSTHDVFSFTSPEMIDENNAIKDRMKEEMEKQEWILSANPHVFNHIKCFEDNGFIDWRQNYNYKVGDVIFVYSSKTVGKITAVAVVEKINLKKEDILDQTKYWKSEEANKGISRFFRLRLIRFIDDDRLGFKVLKQYGLKNAPQVACKVIPQLSDYIHSIID